MSDWILNQQNMASFVLINSSGNEVAGLGNTFSLQISKAGGAFVNSSGTKAEIGNGWYSYLSTVSESDTVGPIALRVTGAGVVQQNLEYTVIGRAIGAKEYTYTVYNFVSGLPIEGVETWVSTDVSGTNTIWYGITDTFGVVRDAYNIKPYLDPGTYYFWMKKPGFSFNNPETEIVP